MGQSPNAGFCTDDQLREILRWYRDIPEPRDSEANFCFEVGFGRAGMSFSEMRALLIHAGGFIDTIRLQIAWTAAVIEIGNRDPLIELARTLGIDPFYSEDLCRVVMQFRWTRSTNPCGYLRTATRDSWDCLHLGRQGRSDYLILPASFRRPLKTNPSETGHEPHDNGESHRKIQYRIDLNKLLAEHRLPADAATIVSLRCGLLPKEAIRDWPAQRIWRAEKTFCRWRQKALRRLSTYANSF